MRIGIVVRSLDKDPPGHSSEHQDREIRSQKIEEGQEYPTRRNGALNMVPTYVKGECLHDDRPEISEPTGDHRPRDGVR